MRQKKNIHDLEFTDLDRTHLTLFFNLADTIADLIGDHCEVALHSLENYDKSLVKIVNGHHTGRMVGSPITDRGLKILQSYEKTGQATSQHYFTHSKYGDLMKSNTCVITRENKKAIGLFCININLSRPFPEIIKTFLPSLDQVNLTVLENFSNHSKETIEHALEQAIKEVESNEAINLKGKNKAIILTLREFKLLMSASNP